MLLQDIDDGEDEAAVAGGASQEHDAVSEWVVWLFLLWFCTLQGLTFD